jgi:uncharacterized protein (TIGR03663 family)
MIEWDDETMAIANETLERDSGVVTVKRTAYWTVEQAAYVAVGLLAAGLRWFQLGLRPLGEGEAVQALAAFRFIEKGVQTAPGGTIPALFSGNVIGFSLMGASDITARWLPALMGLLLALLPYALRHRLGRVGALGAALVLALSPSAVQFSRALDGAGIAAACGLAMFVGLINYLDTQRQGFLYLAAAALGLGLCVGPVTYTLLLILAIFVPVLYLVERVTGRELGWSALVEGWRAARGEKDTLLKAGAVLAATFGLTATTFVLHPGGVGHAADLIGTWVSSFGPEPGGNPALYPLLLLLRYEPLILVLGLFEAGWVLGRSRMAEPFEEQSGSPFPHTAFLAFWAIVAAVIITIAGHRPAGSILLVVVPLALLAGEGIERAWRWLAPRGVWAEAAMVAGVALGLLVFFYLQVGAYSLIDRASTVSIGSLALYATTSYLLLAAMALLLIIALGVAVWFWRGLGVLVGGGWLAILVALGLFGFKAMWGLNFDHAADARELMAGHATAPEVRTLVEELETLSLNQAGDAHTLPITVDVRTGPVVAWYLRGFRGQEVIEGLSAPPGTTAAVTLAVDDPPIGEAFRGQGFPLQTRWLPWGLWGQDLVRWLLFNDATLPPVQQEVVLWVASPP